MTLPIIEIAGSPYDLGYQHGQQAAEQVRATFRRFCNYALGDATTREALTAVMEATVGAPCQHQFLPVSLERTV